MSTNRLSQLVTWAKGRIQPLSYTGSSRRNLRSDPSDTRSPSPSGSSRNPSAVDDAPIPVRCTPPGYHEPPVRVDYMLPIPLDQASQEDLCDDHIPGAAIDRRRGCTDGSARQRPKPTLRNVPPSRTSRPRGRLESSSRRIPDVARIFGPTARRQRRSSPPCRMAPMHGPHSGNSAPRNIDTARTRQGEGLVLFLSKANILGRERINLHLTNLLTLHDRFRGPVNLLKPISCLGFL
jgi:hypothetical protein